MTELDKFELSVWEDIPEAQGEYFEERKMGVLASSAMLNTPLRAYDITLEEDINGEKKLTFSMLKSYVDNKTGQRVENPWIPLLCAERKVKLCDGDYIFEASEKDEEDTENKWSDFIIKQISEDSEKRVNTYTCSEIFTKELGKNGFAVLLDNELNNNTDTCLELAKKILDGSGWTIDKDSAMPPETQEEQLFELTLPANGIDGKNTVSRVPVTGLTGTAYVFYSDVESTDAGWKIKKTDEYLGQQILWKDGTAFDTDEIDENHVVIDDTFAHNYSVDFTSIEGWVVAPVGLQVGDNIIRGKRIIKTQVGKYDPAVKNYVYKFKDADGNEVWGYENTEYITSNTVLNYLVNTTNFVNTNGWEEVGDSEKPLYLVTLPQIKAEDLKGDEATVRAIMASWVGHNYLSRKQRVNSDGTLTEITGYEYYNVGPHNQGIEWEKDKKYVVRLRARQIEKNATTEAYNTLDYTKDPTEVIKVQLGYKSKNDPALTPLSSLIQLSQDMYDSDGYATPSATRPDTFDINTLYYDEQGYTYVILQANDSTPKDAQSLLYVSLGTANFPDYPWHIEDIQLFEFMTAPSDINKPTSDPRIVFPGDIPEAGVHREYNFYTKTTSATGEETVNVVGTDPEQYEPIYTDGFAAIRSISVKESNYFNAINSLGEKFKVWVRYNIKHKKNGELYLDNNQPVKTVKFMQYLPSMEETHTPSIEYGVNLKSIKRKVDSAAIASKLIVKDCTNEQAPSGICSIRKASLNPSGNNIIFNFDYYVNQGLLDSARVIADLYGNVNSADGYYTKAFELNTQMLELQELATKFIYQINSSEEFRLVAESTISNGMEECTTLEDEIADAVVNNRTDEEIQSKSAQVIALKIQIAKAEADKATYEAQKTEYTAKLEKVKTDIADLTKQLNDLNNKFLNKYQRFITEGSWTSNEYIDTELYFIDASRVSSQNAFPKVTYEIDVASLEGSEKHRLLRYRIGEKSYVNDPEFFGYIEKKIGNDTVKTPYRKEIIINKRTRGLDNPSKNKITVKTYKNQYEDLFQKMQAASNNLQFSSAGFERAAKTVNANGSLAMNAIQQSFAQNAYSIALTSNDKVRCENGIGIELIDGNNANNVTRVTSGGIITSKDGGKTWTSAVTSNGINTNMLSAGTIDAATINIVGQSGDRAFAWDETGINALVDKTAYVRFNQDGFYGVAGLSLQGQYNADALKAMLAGARNQNERLDAIKQYANFFLGWDGLSLKAGADSVAITPQDGITIGNGQDTFITLGRFVPSGANTYSYGLRVKNSAGKTVLTASEKGIELEGKITATEGMIGNLTLRNGALSYKKTSFADTAEGVYLSEEGFHLGSANSYFKVNNQGEVECNNINAVGGTIGGWKIYDHSLKIEGQANGIENALVQPPRYGYILTSSKDKFNDLNKDFSKVSSYFSGAVKASADGKSLEVTGEATSNEIIPVQHKTNIALELKDGDKVKFYFSFGNNDASNPAAVLLLERTGNNVKYTTLTLENSAETEITTSNIAVTNDNLNIAAQITKGLYDLEINGVKTLARIPGLASGTNDSAIKIKSEAGTIKIKLINSGETTYSAGTGYCLAFGGTSKDYSDAKFTVDFSGKMTCQGAVVQGTIEAIGGKIGGWTLNEYWGASVLFTKVVGSSDSYGTGMAGGWYSNFGAYAFPAFWAGYTGDYKHPYAASDGGETWRSKCSFYVQHNGYLYAKNAYIEGTIESSTIKGTSIEGSTFVADPYGTNTNLIRLDKDGLYIPYGTNVGVMSQYSYSSISSDGILVSEHNTGIGSFTREISISGFGINFIENDEILLTIDPSIGGGLYWWDVYNDVDLLSITEYDSADYGGGIRYIVHGETISNNNSSTGLNIYGGQVIIGASSEASFYDPTDLTHYICIKNNQGSLNGKSWVLNGSGIQTNSDRNLKKDITSLNSKYLTLFKKLRPVSYRYIDGTSNRLHVGFIAQEVEEAMHTAGLTNLDFAGLTIANETKIDDDGNEIPVQVYRLRYEEFIAILTAQAQEHESRIAALESKIAKLVNL